jgi:hypothetical protein
MTTQADRAAAEAAASQPAREAEVDRIAWSAYAERHRHWSDDVEWWRKAHTCYAKGLEDGARMGREQAYREVFDGLFESLKIPGGLRDVTFREAMDKQLRSIEADARRRAWDATASIPRPGDFKGREAA